MGIVMSTWGLFFMRWASLSSHSSTKSLLTGSKILTIHFRTWVCILNSHKISYWWLGKKNVVIFAWVLPYNKATYECRLARTVVEYYIEVLDSMLKNISGQIRDVDILDPETRQACLKVAIHPVIPQTTQTIITTVSVCAEQYPELIAAKDRFGAEVTYQQLVERIITISTSLQAMEVGTGTRVGLLGPPTRDLLSTIFAICLLGAVYIPIDNYASVDVNRAVADNCEIEVIIVSDTPDTPALVDYVKSLKFSGIICQCNELDFGEDFEVVDESELSLTAVVLTVSSSRRGKSD
jgi:hypothetical protein